MLLLKHHLVRGGLLWVALAGTLWAQGDVRSNRRPGDVYVAASGGQADTLIRSHQEAPDDPPAQRPVKPPAGAMAHQGPWTRGPYQSVQVNVDEFGHNIVGDAANEPSIAVDPLNPDRMVIGWRQFDSVVSNFRQAGWAYSHDGGENWVFPGVIEPGLFRSDPVLDPDAEGNFYYLSLTVDLLNNFRCDVFKSSDGGVSWQQGVFAFGGDKAWMAIDRTDGPGRGNIYVKWQTFFNCCGDRTFTRSANRGQSFMNPLAVPLGPTFGTVAVGPGGEVYAAGIEAVNFQNFNRIVLARSTNAQLPGAIPFFDHSTVVDLGGSMRFQASPNPAGLLGQINVVTDHSNGPSRGNVYMLASVNPPGSDPVDVMFSRSTDGGLSWSDPVRVNDDPIDSGAWQWFGALSVAPNGRIDAVWNDTRNTGAANLSELHYAFSIDGGRTWSGNQPVSPVFNSHLGWPNQNKLGDYYDMTSDNAAVNVAYAATFNGEQDVYFLRLGDCNDNEVHDDTDLAVGTSLDCNRNAVPDECDIAAGTSEDLNGNGVPDECDNTCGDAIEAFLGANTGTNVVTGPDEAEPSCQLNSTFPVWFAYTAPCTADHLLTTQGSLLNPLNDTVLTVFDACGGNEIACDDDGGIDLLSELTLAATIDTTYFIRVSGTGDNVGHIVLNISTLGRCIRRAPHDPEIVKKNRIRRDEGRDER